MAQKISTPSLHFAVIAALATFVASPAFADNSTDVAPTTGWAGQNGGTKGGSAAAAANIYRVTNATTLKAAISAAGSNPAIIKVVGTIDMAAADNGGAFTSSSDQASQGKISLKSNTTLVGVGTTAKLVNAAISISKVNNVIVRNLTIANPCDVGPVWDAADGPTGNWNSQFDAITVDGSKNVWIDRNRFTDAPKTDDQLPIENGMIKQCHDGSFYVKNGSDYVTVSYNVFELHNKNNLIGSSDSTTTDDGHLTVTFNNNHFSNIMERAPRVRFGKVHIYNNYFSASKTHPVYPMKYQIGVAYLAKIISANNAMEITGATKCTEVILNPGTATKTGAISDTGSTLNGVALNVNTTCGQSSTVSWTVPYSVTLLATTAVKADVTSKAGPGKLTVN